MAEVLRTTTPTRRYRYTSFLAASWQSSYGYALINATLFLVLSYLNFALDVRWVSVLVATALVFFLGSLLSFAALLRNGGQLAAISYFVLGAGILFGFGTAYSTVPDSSIIPIAFTSVEQVEMLPIVNLVNAVSVFVVLVTAWPLSYSGPARAMGFSGLRQALNLALPLRLPLLLLGIVVLTAQFATFPYPENLLLRSVITNAAAVQYISIVLGGSGWSRLQALEKLLLITMVALLMVFGLLSISKAQILIPILSLILGLLLDRRSQKQAFVLTALSMVGYFFVIAPLSFDARNEPAYQDQTNSIADRVQILSDAWYSPSAGGQGAAAPELLRRFTATQFQAFLVRQHDAGMPGTTLDGVWQALIPRAFWADKPITTRFGTELDGLYFNRANSDSALAPTFSAEAYWNGGWPVLILISALVGLEIGWFTLKWNLFTRYGARHIGILFFSVTTIRMSGWVESWIGATYVGGFATVFLAILAGDAVVPMLLSLAHKRSERMVSVRRSMTR